MTTVGEDVGTEEHLPSVGGSEHEGGHDGSQCGTRPTVLLGKSTPGITRTRESMLYPDICTPMLMPALFTIAWKSSRLLDVYQ